MGVWQYIHHIPCGHHSRPCNGQAITPFGTLRRSAMVPHRGGDSQDQGDGIDTRAWEEQEAKHMQQSQECGRHTQAWICHWILSLSLAVCATAHLCLSCVCAGCVYMRNIWPSPHTAVSNPLGRAAHIRESVDRCTAPWPSAVYVHNPITPMSIQPWKQQNLPRAISSLPWYKVW